MRSPPSPVHAAGTGQPWEGTPSAHRRSRDGLPARTAVLGHRRQLASWAGQRAGPGALGRGGEATSKEVPACAPHLLSAGSGDLKGKLWGLSVPTFHSTRGPAQPKPGQSREGRAWHAAGLDRHLRSP